MRRLRAAEAEAGRLAAEREELRAVLREFREWQQNRPGATHRPIQDISASAAEVLAKTEGDP